jgi:uncharacterized protein (TIGR00255 family)
MKSMTGFGAGEHAVKPRGKVHVELRALNHRFLEVRVRASRELADLATHTELLARERFSRGRIEIVLRGEGLQAAAPVLDRDRARDAWKQIVELRDAVAPGEPVPLSLLSVVPDLFAVSECTSDELREPVRAALEAAATDLDAMRSKEGAALERALRGHLARVERLASDVLAHAPEALIAGQKRLKERVERLLAVEPDPARIAQEIAILADRSDVTEEVARLRSHAEQLAQLFSDKAPIGRRVDFLLQEMTREANTIGSKSADVAIARTVVELKAEIERMREQAQNVE